MAHTPKNQSEKAILTARRAWCYLVLVLQMEYTKQRRIKRSSSGMSCRTHTAVNGYCPVY